MKKFIYLLIFFSFYKMFGQDPQLFVTTWHLDFLVLNGEQYDPPRFGGEATNITLDLTTNSLTTTYCDTRSTEIVSFNNTNNSFDVTNFESLQEACMFNENQIFENLYFDIFFKTQFPTNIYSYQLSQEGDIITLLLINSSNDFAFFNNMPLSKSDAIQNRIVFYPNPVNDMLHIYYEDVITNLEIYQSQGQLVKSFRQGFENLDVSFLDTGMYFVRMETQNGSILKKLIKK